MTKITADHLDELIAIESDVHFAEPPPLKGCLVNRFEAVFV